MHSYLRAIGFSQIKSRKLLEPIYGLCLKNPNRKVMTTVSIDTSLIQFEKDFGTSIGLSLIGEYDVNGALSVEHYYPYIKGDIFMDYESITIEKLGSKEAYAGICDDYRLGMTTIFYVQNIADYAKSKWLNYSTRDLYKVRLSALSIEGMIIFGVAKNEKEKISEANYIKYRNSLLAAAKNGDMDAITNLTYTDTDTHFSLMNRMKDEDLFSMVDTSFMPYGVESDHYMVVGNIHKVTEVVNTYTKEIVYNLFIECNGNFINVGINKIDLQGEPKVGRRFKGAIWLQGAVRI